MALSTLAGPCCSTVTLRNVASRSAEATLTEYLKCYPPYTKAFDAATKTYIRAKNRCVNIHVLFGGPDMRTLKPGMNHYSAVGSCGAFAAYLRENSLGVVVESPGRPNPLHPERSEGEGDVICYIWSPDREALEQWAILKGLDKG